MTDLPIRREFLKTSAAFAATLTFHPFRDGNIVFDVQTESEATPGTDPIVRAMQTWRPDPKLKVCGLRIAISEHARFMQNQIAVFVQAETKLEPPSTGGYFIFAAMIPISRPLLGAIPSAQFEQKLHRILNAEGTFHWTGEGSMIQEPENPFA